MHPGSALTCQQSVLTPLRSGKWNLGTPMAAMYLGIPKVLIIDDDEFPTNGFEEAQQQATGGYTTCMPHALMCNLYVSMSWCACKDTS